MRVQKKPSQTDENPLPAEIGGYTLTKTPDGLRVKLTAATIYLVFLYRLFLFCLAYVIATTFFRLPKFDGLLFIAVLLCTIPVAWVVFAPIRLGFTVTREQIVVNRFIVCFLHRRHLPITEVTQFSHETFRGSRSFVTGVTLSFYIASKKIVAAKFYSTSDEKAIANALLIESAVDPLLTKRADSSEVGEVTPTDYTWPIGIGLLVICVVSFIVQIVASVFGEQTPALIELAVASYLLHYGGWIALCILAVVALFKMNKNQVIGMVLFAICGYVTHKHELLVSPAAEKITEWALSETEVITAKVKKHAYDAEGVKQYEPRGFFIEYDYKGKAYKQFVQPDSELYQREKKRKFRVGAKLEFEVSKRFPSIIKTRPNPE